jgi:hypothetical protein
MSYQILKIVHAWCMEQRAKGLIESQGFSREYIQALEDVAESIKKLLKFL